MKRVLACFLIILFAGPEPATSQPTTLDECISQGAEPDCGLRHGTASSPCGGAAWYGDRTAWFPLTYVGPIVVELLTAAWEEVQYPAYLEIVPFTGTPTNQFCYEGNPGITIGIVRGGYPCSWERFGPVPLDAYVSIGASYAIQLVSFDTLQYTHSPAINCIRVTVTPLSIAEPTWSQVKMVYKD